MTVNVELTATGKVQTSPFRFHINSRDVTEVFNSNGLNRPASGSLNIGGDITFSADDATGIISEVKGGYNTSDKELKKSEYPYEDSSQDKYCLLACSQ